MHPYEHWYSWMKASRLFWWTSRMKFCCALKMRIKIRMYKCWRDGIWILWNFSRDSIPSPKSKVPNCGKRISAILGRRFPLSKITPRIQKSNYLILHSWTCSKNKAQTFSFSGSSESDLEIAYKERLLLSISFARKLLGEQSCLFWNQCMVSLIIFY